jgi:hypothetical protein
VLLDSRAISHLGAGAGSSFETAISAAASVGVHVTQEGLTGQFITESEVIRSGPFFEDMLLDSLAVIRPSAARTLDRGFKELKISGAGVIIAVLGKLSIAEARQLVACRSEGSQGIALLLDVTTWAEAARHATPAVAVTSAEATGPVSNGAAAGSRAELDSAADIPAAGGAGPPGSDDARADAARGYDATPDGADGPGPRRPPSAGPAGESAAAAAVLRGAGWHVTTIDASTPLAIAWQRLPRAAEMLVATGTAAYPGTADPGAESRQPA